MDGFEVCSRILNLCVVDEKALDELEVQDVWKIYFEIIKLSYDAVFIENSPHLFGSC